MDIELGLQEQKDFLKEWTLTRLKAMTLEDYSNSDKETAFIYWIEKKTEHTGSIWGGSAFKFGIYRRKNVETFFEKKMVKTDGIYAWLTKYGETRDEAFENVKSIIVKIVEYSVASEFEEIDKLDLGEATKWKIAFLYNTENLIPIFNPAMLRRAAETKGLIELKNQPISALQKFLISVKPANENTVEFAQPLWSKVNLDNFYSNIEKFLSQAQTDDIIQQGYIKSYRKLQVKVSFGRGLVARVPWIGLFREPNKILDGIYPVYLYFKADNLLILAYGRSEAIQSKNTWKNEGELETIEHWFFKNQNKKPERYGESFVYKVYDLDETLDPKEMQIDLDGIVDEYLETGNIAEDPQGKYRTRKVWLIATGEGGYLWDEFYKDGVIGVGWNDMEDLSRFASKEEIKQELIKLYPDGSKTPTHNALCLWQFSTEIQKGDIIIAKRGQHEYLGYGIVSGDYYFDPNGSEYKQIIKVDWKKKGIWEESIYKIVTKTLTELTEYPEYVDRLKRLIGIEQEASVNVSTINYYWLNANSKLWKIEDHQIGQEQSYTTRNEKGNKRSKFEYFQKIKPGDLVIGYQTSPIQKVIAIFEITRGVHLDEDSGEEEISFKIQKFLPVPISYSILKAMPELANSEVMRNNQGSLFKLSKEEFDAIIDKDVKGGLDLTTYTFNDAEKEIFLDLDEIKNILNIIAYKKNVILQGPAGAGKTFIAKRLAYLIMEEKDDSKIEMVQFHQSYSYEDFIQGYRPKENGSFKLENGVFYRFCKKAQVDPENKYFFIIDEINRGNLSKIFGELMLLIEADKRSQEYAVSLTYTATSESKFYIPNNIYLIGTMNTADRSLALVDYALRRRFSFISLLPTFNNKFKEELINLGVDEGIIEPIVKRINLLNLAITSDNNLGDGFQIGHSYFCNVSNKIGDIDWFNTIIKYEIAPLLREYWFDSEEKAQSEINRLYIGKVEHTN